VGYTSPARPSALILRWNGRSWRPAIRAGAVAGTLTGITAISARDAWAVGTTRSAHRYPFGKTLILHWNGRSWRQVRAPAPGSNSEFGAVSATSAGSAWAVGNDYSRTNPFGQPLAVRWNGRRWTQVNAPFGYLKSVAATSARNAWAVGGTGGDGLNFPRILHWNGSSWRSQTTPSVPSGGILTAVAATSPASAWAVSQDVSNITLILRWNGRAWKRVRTPRAAAASNLNGLAMTSAASAWAVGQSRTGRILILHWNGTAWS
jgi:hypothetical protein